MEAVKWRSLLVWKPPGRSSGSYYQFSHLATSLTRPVAMCTAFACGAPCSMPVKLGHLPRRTCSVCNAMIGPWSDRSAVSSQRMWPGLGLASYWQSFSLRNSTQIWEREGFAGLGMWSVWVVQSEQHMICRLTASGGREAQANMEETNRERLPWMEANHSWPSKKEHLEIRCEICYACS